MINYLNDCPVGWLAKCLTTNNHTKYVKCLQTKQNKINEWMSEWMNGNVFSIYKKLSLVWIITFRNRLLLNLLVLFYIIYCILNVIGIVVNLCFDGNVVNCLALLVSFSIFYFFFFFFFHSFSCRFFLKIYLDCHSYIFIHSFIHSVIHLFIYFVVMLTLL